jgi:methyl-accepting chemotaxis protein
MRISDFSIKTRLAVGFWSILAVVALSVVVTLFALQGIGKKSQRIKEESFPCTVVADELAFDTVQVQQFLTDVSATHDPDGYKDAELAAKGFQDGLARFEEKARREDDAKSLQAIKEMRDDFNAYYLLGQRMANVYVTQGVAQGNLVMKEFDKSSEKLTEKVKKFRLQQIQQGNDIASSMAATVGALQESFAGLGLLVVALGLFVSYLISRSITTPLASAVQVIGEIAKGDLTVRMPTDSGGEIGVLADRVNGMVHDMHEVLASVVAASLTLASASDELKSSSVQVAANMDEVASQSSAVAQASGEMAQTSSDIARTCSMAAGSSAEVNGSVQQSSATIQGTVRGMQRVSDRVTRSAQSVTKLGTQSEQIGEIIGTIEDIADQTNLLALNAAIEAARAGEQGRGFAVVADEVRALATRTTNATRDIGEMISAIQKEIREAVSGMELGVKEAAKGTEEAAKSGSALETILSQVGAVSGQIGQIATAAEEQSATTTEVSTTLQRMNRAVEEASAGVRISSSAATQLAVVAEELQRKVQQFKLVA